LLKQGASLDKVVSGDRSFSYTNWEWFMNIVVMEARYELRSVGKKLRSAGTAAILLVLLEHGADPFVWAAEQRLLPHITAHYHRRPDITYCVGRRPREGDIKSNIYISLRNMVEAYPPPNAKSILALLPSHEQYARVE
jgi:hypothetical protein